MAADTVSVCDFSLFASALLLFSDHMLSSLSSGIMVHLPSALWPHVWTPLHAYQALHPQQGGVRLLNTNKYNPSTLNLHVLIYISGSVTFEPYKHSGHN